MIRADHISKTFRLYRKPADRLKELLLRRHYHTVYHALHDVSFHIAAGQALGIIGPNGAGKSTLLKILTGVLLPDAGQMHIAGRVTGLLELGTGFNLELNGLDNLRINAMLLGMTPEQIETRRAAIVSFAELGQFIQEPLKTYSSGMVMRLAFAIAIHADPTCFVVDEALAVGDAYFQQKCLRAIQQFREQGGSILFVSHDMNAVKMLCDEALLLEQGRVIEHGQTKAVVDHYHALFLSRSHQGDLPIMINAPPAAPAVSITPTTALDAPLATTGEVQLLTLQLHNTAGEPIEQLTSEDQLTISARLRILRDLDEPHYGIGIRNRLGQSVFETNTYCMNLPTSAVTAGTIITVTWQFTANLIKGDYSITVGVGNRPYGTGSFNEILFFAHDVALLTILTNTTSIRYDGYFNMYPTVTIQPTT